MTDMPPNDVSQVGSHGSGSSSLKSAQPPTATIQNRQVRTGWRLRTRLWWLTALCAALAIGLWASAYRARGTTIQVTFKDGYGLKPGDGVRYRGIEVGRVTGVVLSDDRKSVDVEILLDNRNQSLAVEGSRFWIQRARLSLGQITGLDTVLGAKYVGLLPGDSDNPRSRFEGLETPLAMTDGESAELLIQFAGGEGLEVGQAVRFRGIKVGEVTFVQLRSDLQSIEVSVRLVGSASQLARVGTQFWIERPRLELTEIRGLDTLIAGSYVAMEPGTANAAPSVEFVGLTEPPPLAVRPGSLEIELDAGQRMGIVRGAPITYRGLEVGRVSQVGLARDAASVKISAVIDAQYAELVREDSKWWVVGGIQFSAGLSGISVSVDSLSAWIRGGIAFATPPAPGKQVVTGHRFTLEPQAQSQWQSWQPRIAIGADNQTLDGLALPAPVRVVASWKSSVLGITRRNSDQCWGLVLDDGKLLIPNNLLSTSRRDGRVVTIEVAGTSFPLDEQIPIELGGELAKLTCPAELSVERWPTNRVSSHWNRDNVLLVVNPELSEPLAIDNTRLALHASGGLSIAPGVSIAKQLLGSPVIDASTGMVFGLLVLSENGWIVGALP
ncbi:MAG: MCE family protein [Pirellulaceae bacterium]|nr:MCE family protein [Pirellulaceae bacterium]